MSGQFTSEERAKVVQLNEQLMRDATGAAVVIIGLESDKNALLVANRRLAAALKRVLDNPRPPSLDLDYTPEELDTYNAFVIAAHEAERDARAALREAGVEDA